jgi:peptidoglycan/LPS O-acetylase OafA/YrhL
LFLLLVAALSVLLFLLPVYEVPSSDPAVLVPKPYLITINPLLSILNGTIGILTFVCIFLFRNRNLQLRLANVNLLLICILIGLLFFLADTLGTTVNAPISYRYGSYLPLIQLVFTFLASRAIRKDEELVRSADRLR